MEEVSACLRMLDEVYAVFGLTYKAALSTRPEGYLGTLEQWDRAEDALKEALGATGKAWEVGSGPAVSVPGVVCANLQFAVIRMFKTHHMCGEGPLDMRASVRDSTA